MSLRDVLLLTIAAGGLSAQELAWPAAVATACRAASPTDSDLDGTAELTLLAPFAHQPEPGAAERPGVLVIVEPRLAGPPVEGTDLRPALRTYLSDLAAEGWNAAAITASVYAGERHQDGLTLLALREFLRDLRSRWPRLDSVVLIGAFPDALLVRQYAWWKHDKLTINKGQPAEQQWKEKIDFLRSRAENVCTKADIVLGDLDGRWEELYHRGPEKLPWYVLPFPDGRATLAAGSVSGEQGEDTYEDFFFLHDGVVTIKLGEPGRMSVSIAPETHDECAEADRQLPNIIAQPELSISRLDARHAAVVPDPQIVDQGGRRLLDDQGRPQQLVFAAAAAVPQPRSIWVASEPSERAMLADWFERRHRYRLGEFAANHKPANIGTGWGSSVKEARQAFAPWANFDEPGYDILRGDVSLLEVIEWLKRPATARAIKAHGDPWGCLWEKPKQPVALQAAVGTSIWNWRKQDVTLTPGLSGTTNKLDFAVTRSLYESGTLPAAPAIYLYTSCEGTMPAQGADQPYNAPGYGFWQGGECILFHLRGLALIGRSKVFYDQPREMWSTLAAGGTMGDVWKRYFAVEAADAELGATNGIGRKRALFWNVLGDCTVRLVSPPP